MASDEMFSEEFVSKLRSNVKESIEYISEKTSMEELPRREYYTVGDNSKVIKTESRNLVRSVEIHRDKLEYIFEELAQWAVKNPSKCFEVELHIETQPGDDITLEDIDYDPDHNQQKNSYVRTFIEITSETIKYTGSLDFEESGFQTAVSETEATKHHIPKEYIVICPIINLNIPTNKINLSNEFNIYDRQEGEWVKKVEISSLTPSEKAMIYNAEKGSQFRDTGLGNRDWPNKVKVTMEGYTHASNSEQIIETITSSLRLLSPDSEPVAAGPQYRYRPEKPYIDGKVPRWNSMTGPEFILRTARTREMYQLNTDMSSKLEEFWNKNADLVNPYGQSELAAAVRRYNETYKKSNMEDRIVDAVIAIEGTVLKDLGNQSSILFRLGVRCGSLLDKKGYNNEYLQDFLKNMYYARGEIVHKNRRVSDIMDDDRFKKLKNIENEKNFVNQTRIFLSSIIQAYLFCKNKSGKSITEINQEIDRGLKNTSYSPAE